MKKTSTALILFLMLQGLSAPIEAQNNTNAGGSGWSSMQNSQQDAHRRRMRSLMEALMNARTDEQRKGIYPKIRQEIEEYRAANPPKELTPLELAARKQTIDEKLKKDKFLGEKYKLSCPV